MVYQAYADYHDISLSEAKKVTLEEMNEWLEMNSIEVQVSRYPIPHKGGVYIARVKSLHDRKGMSELNVVDVRQWLEGDGDGDEVQIELLTSDMLNAVKTSLESVEQKSVNLNDFSSKKKYDILNTQDRFELIYKSTMGEKSIGELANIQSVYGMLANLFDSISVAGTKLRIKQPNEIIKWDVMYKGKQGWEGTVADFLRIFLQGAVDNGQYGVLGEWEYGPGDTFNDPSGQEKIWMMLFEQDILGIKKDFNPNEDLAKFRKFVRPVINIFKEAAYIRRGSDFNTGRFSLSDIIEKSENYYSLMRDGRKNLKNTLGNMGVSFEFKENVSQILLPVEQIAIAPARILEEMDYKHNLFGYETTPFKITRRVHENAHADAMLHIEGRLQNILFNAVALDNKSQKFKDSNLSQGKWAANEAKVGAQYAKAMGNEFYKLLAKSKQFTNQTMDRNPEFISFKEDFDSKFRELSYTAKIAATYTFLRGYMRMSDDLKRVHKSAKFPEAIPPVSKTKGEISLLSPTVMSYFFQSYNESVSKDRKADSLATLPAGEVLSDVIKDNCG
jgi:hypothetical protein